MTSHTDSHNMGLVTKFTLLTQHAASSANSGLRNTTACIRRDFQGSEVAKAAKITRKTSEAAESSVTSMSGITIKKITMPNFHLSNISITKKENLSKRNMKDSFP